MLIQQQHAIFPLCEVGTDITSSTELNSVNMAGYDHATFIIQFASTVGFTTAPEITIESATSDSGDTADVTFHYSLGSASAATLSTAMTYAADATASTWSNATADAFAGHTLILQVEGNELRSTSLGKVYNWLTVDIGQGVTTGTIDAFCILSNPRYAAASMPVAI